MSTFLAAWAERLLDDGREGGTGDTQVREVVEHDHHRTFSTERERTSRA